MVPFQHVFSPSAGEGAPGGSSGGSLPSREALDELARENASLREALTALAIERGAAAASDVKGLFLSSWHKGLRTSSNAVHIRGFPFLLCATSGNIYSGALYFSVQLAHGVSASHLVLIDFRILER